MCRCGGRKPVRRGQGRRPLPVCRAVGGPPVRPAPTPQKPRGQLKSRIRPTLLEGSVVTATRTNLHYVVTEYGKFNAKGKSTWERAEGLIAIAHPQFREELIAEAEKMHIWRRSNKR